MSNIKIQLNHQEQELPAGSTLAQLISQQLGGRQKGIAVAINQRVIPKAEHDQYILQTNDQILIIKATQGG
ncbi:sulfur carrier protein ThiS [Olivibacter sitiensis]|uniref:sulfur carrier protein ThiS n=1 Tax=Olivibacter sitiensis TaxID=376470 RepID=UPI00146FC863|nr:sulfur carrier protein ThiS [Olivibacter sitiensis]